MATVRRDGFAMGDAVYIAELVADYATDQIQWGRPEDQTHTRVQSFVTTFFTSYGGLMPTKVVFFDVDETLCHRTPERIKEFDEAMEVDFENAVKEANGPLNYFALKRWERLRTMVPDVAFVAITSWAVGRPLTLLRKLLIEEGGQFAEQLYGKIVDYLTEDDEDALATRCAYPIYTREDEEVQKLLGLKDKLKEDKKKWANWLELRKNFLERTLKIYLWLEDHPEVTHYVIFDDRFLEVYDKCYVMNSKYNEVRGIFGERFIHVDSRRLVTKKNISRALTILNKFPPRTTFFA